MRVLVGVTGTEHFVGMAGQGASNGLAVGLYGMYTERVCHPKAMKKVETMYIHDLRHGFTPLMQFILVITGLCTIC